MGLTSSRDNNFREQEDLRMKALINYDRRIKSYNFAYHGYYLDYVEWCRGQYELECKPEYCRQGSNYSPQYDQWGYEEY